MGLSQGGAFVQGRERGRTRQEGRVWAAREMVSTVATADRPSVPYHRARTTQTSLRACGSARQNTEIVGKMAPRVGLEPTTNRLTADCSTVELPRNTEAATKGLKDPSRGASIGDFGEQI